MPGRLYSEEQLPQNAAEGLGGLPHHNSHDICSFLNACSRRSRTRSAGPPPETSAPLPERSPRSGSRPPAPPRRRPVSSIRRLSETYAPRPFLTPSIYAAACPGTKAGRTKRPAGICPPVFRAIHFFRLLPVLEGLELLIQAQIALRGGSAGSRRCAPPPARRSPSPWCGCTPRSGTGPDRAGTPRKVSGRRCFSSRFSSSVSKEEKPGESTTSAPQLRR